MNLTRPRIRRACPRRASPVRWGPGTSRRLGPDSLFVLPKDLTFPILTGVILPRLKEPEPGDPGRLVSTVAQQDPVQGGREVAVQ